MVVWIVGVGDWVDGRRGW